MGRLSNTLRNIENSGLGIAFFCPGCNCMHSFRVEGVPPYPVWQWNQDVDKPTFTPSLLVQYKRWVPPVNPENFEHWRNKSWEQTEVDWVCHSYVTDGNIQFLGDCTHDLKGTTVPIPEWDKS